VGRLENERKSFGKEKLRGLLSLKGNKGKARSEDFCVEKVSDHLGQEMHIL
jgi:hypothetical protein